MYKVRNCDGCGVLDADWFAEKRGAFYVYEGGAACADCLAKGKA